MAAVTLDRLAEGIRRANEAGDTETVKKLGIAYRQMQAGGSDGPPAGAQPGSREYADWALQQARAGKALPQVSQHTEFQAPQPNGLMDKAFTAAGSFIEGVPIAGPTLIDLAKQGRAAVQGMTPDAVDAEFAAAKEANPLTSLAGNITGSVAALAPLGATAVGGRLLGTTGTLGQRIGMGALSGSAISGADTAARGGDAGEIGTNMALGGLLGTAFPLVGAGFRKAVSPFAKTATDKATKLLQSEGVDLTAGQKTGSKGLLYREAELGGSAAQVFKERQAKQFTAAALRRAGINADEASHDVIDRAFTDIGGMFDDLASRNSLTPDKKLAQDLQAAWRRFEGSTNPSTRPKVVERLIADIYGKGNANAMPGQWYQSTRSELGRLSRSTNPELAEAARDMQFALDDAMERTLAKTNPGDAAAWKQARRLYRNMLVVEDAATRAGAQSADGIITPQALRSAAIRQNKRAFARGRNDFTDLADAGVSKMTPLPDSGTPGRLDAKAVLPLGAGAGMGIGGSIAGLPGAAIGGVAGAAIPWAAGRAMLSAPGRAFLGNSVAAGGRALPALPPALLPLEVTRRREPIQIEVRGGAR